jgi:hypothetical protein
LLLLHEIVEEEIIHPLARRLDPDEHLVDRLLDEESRLSDALGDAVRTGAAREPRAVAESMRDLFRAHAGHEERLEFPRARAAVPADELRQLAFGLRAAEEAAAADAGPGGDAAVARPGTLPRTADLVRDALRA